jgi:hypothetical protein
MGKEFQTAIIKLRGKCVTRSEQSAIVQFVIGLLTFEFASASN